MKDEEMEETIKAKVKEIQERKVKDIQYRVVRHMTLKKVGGETVENGESEKLLIMSELFKKEETRLNKMDTEERGMEEEIKK